MKTVVEYLGKVSITVEEGDWSIDKAYDRLTLVTSEDKGYISRTAVPKGVELSDTKYWKFLFVSENVKEDVERIKQQITAIFAYLENLDGALEDIQIDVNALKSIPVYKGTGAHDILLNNNSNIAQNGSTAEGSGTQAIGIASHAEGLNTKATANNSHAEGKGTEISTPGGHVEGNYNYTKEGIHIIGIGEEDDKKDAEVIDVTGNKYLIGVGGYEGTTRTGKKTVQTVINEAHTTATNIAALVPAQATSNNKLADKDFVNSSIATNTATFKGTFNSESDLQNVDADANDYAFVIAVDSAGNTQYKRYKYVVEEGEPDSWMYEYTLNNSSFTAAQWTAINSGVTATFVSNTNTNIGQLQTVVTSIQEIVNNSPVVRGTGSGSLKHKNVNNDNNAAGIDSVAEGKSTIAGGDYSHAEGQSSMAYGQGSHAEGHSTHELPNGTLATNIVEKWETTKFNTAWGLYSHTEGEDCLADGDYSHSEGYQTRAIGESSHSEGNLTKAGNYTKKIIQDVETIVISGNNSHAEGEKGTAIGVASHVEGKSSHTAPNTIDSSTDEATIGALREAAETLCSIARGEASHVEGEDCIAFGNYSHAEGSGTYAKGNYSHAEGAGSVAGGMCSHAEGNRTRVSGDYSHAEGYMTQAPGMYSHAEGYGSAARGNHSHAGGYQADCYTNTDCSFAHGDHVRVNNGYEASFGKYNKSNKDNTNQIYTRFSIGNGTADNNRINILELLENGAFYLTNIGNYDGTNPDTAKSLQQVIATLLVQSASVRNIVTLTQTEYDALVTKDPNTEYNII